MIKTAKKEFTRKTLNTILDEVVDEYFSDETIENGYGLMDVIESVIAGYTEEIESLPQ